jgi:hypothetical protein
MDGESTRNKWVGVGVHTDNTAREVFDRNCTMKSVKGKVGK